jgi:hypothetical protein
VLAGWGSLAKWLAYSLNNEHVLDKGRNYTHLPLGQLMHHAWRVYMEWPKGSLSFIIIIVNISSF